MRLSSISKFIASAFLFSRPRYFGRSMEVAVPTGWRTWRFGRVAAFLVAASTVTVVWQGTARSGWAGGRAETAGRGVGEIVALSARRAREAAVGAQEESLLQGEKDAARVQELKHKLAQAQASMLSGAAVSAAARRPAHQAKFSPTAAAAAGNKASKPLIKGELRDAWLSTAVLRASPRKSTASRREIKDVLQQLQASMAEQARATRAALTLLKARATGGDTAGDAGTAEQQNSDSDADGHAGAGIQGERGRTGEEERGNVEAQEAGASQNHFSCSNVTLEINETQCIPQACNASAVNALWNASLPECAEAETSFSGIIGATKPPPVSESKQNESENTATPPSAVEGNVRAGVQAKPSFDTIYCYDDAPDGDGFVRHARSATYCWYHRAYCELYCEGDINTTPPPVDMNSPAAAAYGWKSGYVSWKAWAKRLKLLSPYATLGPALIGEPTWNAGGIKISEVSPVKVPETTGTQRWGQYDRYFQDGR